LKPNGFDEVTRALPGGGAKSRSQASSILGVREAGLERQRLFSRRSH
jgi:hypothetical protein